MATLDHINVNSDIDCKIACLALIERGASFNVVREGDDYRIYSDDGEGLWLISNYDFPTPVYQCRLASR